VLLNSIEVFHLLTYLTYIIMYAKEIQILEDYLVITAEVAPILTDVPHSA